MKEKMKEARKQGRKLVKKQARNERNAEMKEGLNSSEFCISVFLFFYTLCGSVHGIKDCHRSVLK